MQRLFLTRRNLLALLSKLDRNQSHPGSSQCTIIKQDTVHSVYPCSDIIQVTAVEDAEYYADRAAGEVFPADLPRSHADNELCNCPSRDLWGCRYK